MHVIRGTLTALGLTWFRGKLSYVASTLSRVTGIVARYSDFNGRAFAHRRVVIPAISVGLHGLGTLVPGPNGRLYLGAGAEQDALAGGHVTSGTVGLQGRRSDLRIEATGVRRPFGLAFIPGTASLLVTDNGRDDLGVHRPPDELNLVRDVTARRRTSASRTATTRAGARARGRPRRSRSCPPTPASAASPSRATGAAAA